jgi:hypothetical protein
MGLVDSAMKAVGVGTAAGFNFRARRPAARYRG